MVDNKTVGISTIMALIISLGIVVGPGFFDEPRYSCDTNDLIVSCDGFSKYVDPNGKCLNAVTIEGISLGNKICRSGWKLIVDDRVPESHLEDTGIVYDDNNKRQEFTCDVNKKCEELK